MHLGTSLINAYKRSHEMSSDDSGLTTLLMERAHDILTQLAADRLANSMTYGAVAGMHAQVRAWTSCCISCPPSGIMSPIQASGQ